MLIRVETKLTLQVEKRGSTNYIHQTCTVELDHQDLLKLLGIDDSADTNLDAEEAFKQANEIVADAVWDGVDLMLEDFTSANKSR